MHSGACRRRRLPPQVMHGADSDVVWLQRDFHIYCVNVFDTARASQVRTKTSVPLPTCSAARSGVHGT